MHDWLYTIRKRFTVASSDRWTTYIKFSGLEHVHEIVSLDCSLCPEIVTDLTEEDWKHNVHEAYRITLFRDSDYLKSRQPLDPSQNQILSIIESPRGDETAPAGFFMCGFDIMDSDFHYSAITNCGQMPDIFDASIVNETGLISTVDVANEIRDRMRRAMPDDPHLGKCEVWSIARAAL